MIIKPKILVPLGNWATKYVLSGFDPQKMSKVEGMTKTHGQKSTIEKEGQSFFVIPAFHPAAAIHNERFMPFVHQDFDAIQKFINSPEYQAGPPPPSRPATTTKKQLTLESMFARREQ
jgi:uracil-DNA glycosylase family 4